MYKACIFDLDGTLTDTLESLVYSVNATLTEMGLAEISGEQVRAFVGNGAKKLLEKSLMAAGDLQASRIEEAMEVYARIFKTGCTYKVAPYEGIVEMLQVLHGKGVKLAVLSNKPDAQTKSVVATFFEEGLFTYVQGQREDIPRKPDPAAVYLILDKLQVAKEESLYIGDSEVDMITGNAAGVATIGVTWGFRDREVLVQEQAQYLVDKAEEIISIVEGVN
jgi:phosphoglycolate phosphatase